MNPSDDQLAPRVGASVSNQPRPLTPPPRDYSGSQAAAADIIRGQIDSIYSNASQETTLPAVSAAPIAEQSSGVIADPIDKQLTAPARPQPNALTAAAPQATGSTVQQPDDTARRPQQTIASTHHPQATPEQWKQYHSAWQKYYQMYYERYYANHLQTRWAELDQIAPATSRPSTASNVATEAHDMSNDKINTIKRLRSQIQEKVASRAKAITRSRHFVPIAAGTLVFLSIMVIQFNQPVLAFFYSYTTPGSIDPQNIIASASSDLTVSPEPRLIIPRINVDMPVIYGVNAADQNAQLKAMENGAVHFSVVGASAVPGQVGNTVLAAHSSNDAFAPGNYKSAFIHNEKLTKDDVIYVHYQGKRYTYSVTKSEVVLPNEVSRVQIQTDKPLLTLVSCVPIGTAHKRLLVFAEQISPDPAATPAPKSQESTTRSTDIPGKSSPTLLEKLFGAQ